MGAPAAIGRKRSVRRTLFGTQGKRPQCRGRTSQISERRQSSQTMPCHGRFRRKWCTRSTWPEVLDLIHRLRTRKRVNALLTGDGASPAPSTFALRRQRSQVRILSGALAKSITYSRTASTIAFSGPDRVLRRMAVYKSKDLHRSLPWCADWYEGPRRRKRYFLNRDEAENCESAHLTSIRNRGLPLTTRALEQLTVGNLLKRYRDEVTPAKPGAALEIYRLNWLLNNEPGKTLAGKS